MKKIFNHENNAKIVVWCEKRKDILTLSFLITPVYLESFASNLQTF